MDTFIEQIVPIQNTTSKILLKISIWVGAFIVAGVAFIVIGNLPFIGFFSIFAVTGILFGTYKWVSSMNIEYEYSITNGSFDIDKIIAKRKRKRILTANCRDFESFGKYLPEKHANITYQTQIIAANLNHNQLWCGVINNGQLGNTLIVLEPSEKTLSAVKKSLPSMVARDAFGGN